MCVYVFPLSLACHQKLNVGHGDLFKHSKHCDSKCVYLCVCSLVPALSVNGRNRHTSGTYYVDICSYSACLHVSCFHVVGCEWLEGGRHTIKMVDTCSPLYSSTNPPLK